jgi:hypothetical protein
LLPSPKVAPEIKSI